MTPSEFQSPRTLRRLNIVAVGLALASVTGMIFGTLDAHSATAWSVITAAPTLVLGSLWAWLMRGEKTIGRSSVRRGWVASIPIAALNAGLAMGLLLVNSETGPRLQLFSLGVLIGVTYGALVWIPALIATLVCFGVPIAWAQRLARRGLAGEERGEKIVGSVCVAMSAAAMLFMLRWDAAAAHQFVAVATMRALAFLGVAAGGSAALLANAREARRRAFVAAAEAGKVPNYRVDATAEGKVLMRVVSQGEGYRVGDFDEALVVLDAEGNVKRADA